MDPAIVAAIIGAAAAIVAALIAVVIKKRSKEEGTPPVERAPLFSASGSAVQAGRDVSDSIIGSTHTKIDRSQYHGPVTKVEIGQFLAAADAKLLLPREPEETTLRELLFITERELPYSNYRTGLALSFTLRNQHDTQILIHSLRLDLLDFKDASSSEFREILGHAHGPPMYNSAPIPVYGIRVQVDARSKTCESVWGGVGR